MIVKLVASTELRDTDFGYITHWEQLHPGGECQDEPEEFFFGDMQEDGSVEITSNPEWDEWYKANIPTDADELAEAAGRLCYLSWDRPNPKTSHNRDYIANILKQQHESVLEHASATFYLGGVSRSFTHELIRHRHLSFSQASQRYVDSSAEVGELAYVVPPAVFDEDGQWAEEYPEFDEAFQATQIAYIRLAHNLRASGLSKKQALEAARAVLPNFTPTQILVSGNMRAWRDVLQKRLSSGADAEFQLVAKEILKELLKIAPNSFQDLKELGND